MNGAGDKLRDSDGGWLQAWHELTCKDSLLWWRRDILHIGGDDTIAIHVCADSLEAAKDQTMFVAENDVAESSHDLYDKAVMNPFIAIWRFAVTGDDL